MNMFCSRFASDTGSLKASVTRYFLSCRALSTEKVTRPTDSISQPRGGVRRPVRTGVSTLSIANLIAWFACPQLPTFVVLVSSCYVLLLRYIGISTSPFSATYQSLASERKDAQISFGLDESVGPFSISSPREGLLLTPFSRIAGQSVHVFAAFSYPDPDSRYPKETYYVISCAVASPPTSTWPPLYFLRTYGRFMDKRFE